MSELRELFPGRKKRAQAEKFAATLTRRGLFGGFAGLAGLAAMTGVGTTRSAAAAIESLGLLPEDLPSKKYRAATVEVLGASTWVSHGMETAKFYGDLLGVEVQSFDGENSAEKQLQALQAIANEQWDFVALHPQSSDALIDGTDAIIEKGIPLIDMDTRIVQDPEANMQYGFLTYLEPDNIYMGATVATELFKAIGGEGEVIHTQGSLGHTGAQGRAEGFKQTVANYPGITVVDETPG
ncbi:MAG: sugar ABC transporter substrate-binding protein, partial [Aldersonia sp.]|nr:sugar ABC transporter substrate-binding protein [Aldersonia sp.]